MPAPRHGAHAAGRALAVRTVELLPLAAEIVPAPQVFEQPGLAATAVDEHRIQVVVGGGAVVRPREHGRVGRRGRPEHPVRTGQPKLPDELLSAGRSQGQAELRCARGDRSTYEGLQPYVLEAAALCAMRSCAPSNSSEAPRPPRSHTLPRSATREWPVRAAGLAPPPACTVLHAPAACSRCHSSGLSAPVAVRPPKMKRSSSATARAASRSGGGPCGGSIRTRDQPAFEALAPTRAFGACSGPGAIASAPNCKFWLTERLNSSKHDVR